MSENEQDYVSVFVGICKSQELLNELLSPSHIESKFKAGFHIFYEEDCLITSVNSQMSDNVDEIFSKKSIFDIELLKQDYSNHLDRPYNTAIVIRDLKYDGEVKEILDDKFGYFKFLGIYPLKPFETIADAGNTYDYAIDKLVQWGYTVSVLNDSVEFPYTYIAEKDGKKYSARDPLRLLGLITIIREYGEEWRYSDVPRSFSIEPVQGAPDEHDLMWGYSLDPDQIEE
ncbi:MAG: hypothetical protein K2M91_06590 [Lachnospiraceae bacterium]|nr:hypothetical protein [Lachnospiraceae bacterium]